MEPSAVYREFLQELSAYDRFIQRRQQGRADIDRHDPDVRRLVEAMAFFSAHSRLVASHEATQALSRLAGDYFAGLLVPLPTMAMLHAQPGERQVEPAFLPQGEELRLSAQDAAEVPITAQFSTLRSAVLDPLSLRFEGLDYHRSRGFRITLSLERWVSAPEALQVLPLYLSSLDDYLSSVGLQYGLRQHLAKVSVVYGARPSSEASGQLCSHSFGALPVDLDREDVLNALWRIRTFFQFPQQGLYLNIKPAPGPSGWRRAWLLLDLGPDWPADIYVDERSFTLGVQPIANLQRAYSAPILCDGVHDQYDIVSDGADPDVQLYAVRGVYKLMGKALEPLRPLVLPNTREGYEIIRSGTPGRRPQLSLRLPSAFAEPVKLVVDALWHKPSFDGQALGQVSVGLQRRKVEGVQWSLAGELVPHRKSTLPDDEVALLRLMALRQKRRLDRHELVALMELLGAGPDSYHAGMGALLLDVKVQEQPMSDGGGTQLIYELTLDDVQTEQQPLMFDYLGQLWSLLQSWSGCVVDVVVMRKGRPAQRLQPARPA